MSHFSKVFTMLLLLINVLYAKNSKPDWIEKRPINDNFYIGIGVAKKSENNRDYIQKAKNYSLRELASEITINISSEIFNKIVEKSGILKEEFRSQIYSSTKAELERFELVDTWEDENEYWVYYKLSKKLYKEQRQKKIQKAVTLSLDLFSKAKKNDNDNNIEKALLFYFQSLNPINKLISEPLETYYNGERIFLLNEIYYSLQNLLSKIEIRTKVKEHKAKIGQPLNNPLEVSIIYDSDVYIANLPLKFSFIRGSGELNNYIRTDQNGNAKCNIIKITSNDKIQLVKVELDINRFVKQDSNSIIYQNIIKTFSVPYIEFVLNISGLAIFIESNELNLDNKMDVPVIEPTLKEFLANRGHFFVDKINDADLQIEIKANTQKGMELYGIFTSFADVTISIIDTKNQKEVFKKVIPKTKGHGIDFNNAGSKALENASKELCLELDNFQF